MYPNEVLRIQNAVLVLPSSVHDFCREILPLVPDRLAEGVLDRWVVAVHEKTIDELNSEGRFTYFQ